MNAYETIVRILDDQGIATEILDHPRVQGCEDSLAHREQAGWTGASSKCILFHAKGVFHLVVTTADRRINARHFKKPFATKNIRFATPDEVGWATGCEIGSMPPFGHQSTEMPIYVDAAILERSHFMFNPADPGKSFRIPAKVLPAIYAFLPNPVLWFTDNEAGKLDFSPEPPGANRG